MSGGFFYQYDPYGDLPKKVSHDSILIGSIADQDDPHAAFHADAIRMMLAWHGEATGSEKAQWLLDNFDSEKSNFAYGLPRALLLYQDTDAILKAKSRKDLIDELGTALAAHQVRKFKLAYRDRKPILNGKRPAMARLTLTRCSRC